MALSALALMAMTIFSCSNKKANSPDVIAAVGTSKLTDKEISRAIPPGLPAADSLQRVEAYVNQWIADQLLSTVAIRNIHDTKQIDRLTEEYRRQLIAWQYRHQMVQSDTSLQVSDSDIHAFYEANTSQYHATEPYYRGIFLSIPLKSPQINNARKLLPSSAHFDIDKLEKFATAHSSDYHYFADKWMGQSELLSRFPALSEHPTANKTYEHTDETTLSLLHISEVLPSGAIMPEELVRPQIKNLLEQQNAVKIDRILHDRLRAEAEQKGLIYLRNNSAK